VNENVYAEIYDLVRQIPPGKVSSYGRIALMLGRPGHARLVGYALHALGDDGPGDVPWWRVINAAGRISNPYAGQLQRALLEAEGLRFDARGYVDLDEYVWEG
jgi:methylated-DNA-protein-cysteine methyltransferase-like protein